MPTGESLARIRNSSSARKPLQTFSQDAQNYAYHDDRQTAAPKKRRRDSDLDLREFQRIKKPRLDHGHVTGPNHSDSNVTARGARTPAHGGTFFDISASTFAHMLRGGSSVRVGIAESVHPAMTSPTPKFHYDRVGKTFNISKDGVIFTMSTASTGVATPSPATSVASDDHAQKNNVNVSKGKVHSPTRKSHYSFHEQSRVAKRSIGSKSSLSATSVSRAKVARFVEDNNVGSTLKSRTNGISGDMCPAKSRFPIGAGYAPITRQALKANTSGNMESPKHPHPARSEKRIAHPRHKFPSGASMQRHFGETVHQKTMARPSKPALIPSNLISGTNMRSSSLPFTRSNVYEYKDHPRRKFSWVTSQFSGNLDPATTPPNVKDSAASPDIAEKESSSEAVSGLATCQEERKPNGLSSGLLLNGDLTPSNLSSSTGLTRQTNNAESSRKLGSRCTSLPGITNIQSGERDNRSYTTPPVETSCTSRRGPMEREELGGHTLPSEYSNDNDTDTHASCKILKEPKGYSCQQSSALETNRSQKKSCDVVSHCRKRKLDHNEPEEEQESIYQRAHKRLRDLFYPHYDDSHGMRKRLNTSQKSLLSMPAQDPVRSSSSFTFDNEDTQHAPEHTGIQQRDPPPAAPDRCAQPSKRHIPADEYFDTYCRILDVSPAVAEEALEHIQAISRDQTVENGTSRAIIATCLALVAHSHQKSCFTALWAMFEATNVPYDEILQVREDVLREVLPEWLSWNIGEEDPLWPERPDPDRVPNRSFRVKWQKNHRYKLYCQERARKKARGPTLTEKLDTLFGIRFSSNAKERTQVSTLIYKERYLHRSKPMRWGVYADAEHVPEDCLKRRSVQRPQSKVALTTSRRDSTRPTKLKSAALSPKLSDIWSGMPDVKSSIP
ncbi:MAG: hypothetical protein Q9174_003918, partial [Haloplaca sp. 1 TL-2023]